MQWCERRLDSPRVRHPRIGGPPSNRAMTVDTGSDLLVERRGAALWLTITREARRNAMNPAVLAGIAAGLDRAEAEAGIRVVVITGAGDKAFCAGADLQAGDPFGADLSNPHGA